MLKWFTSLMAGVVMAVVAPAAHAGFIHTNVSTVGDAGAFVHQETGIEWLNTRYTDGKSINQALASYPGWRLPTEDEVIQLSQYIFKMATQHFALYPVANDGATDYTNSGYSSCANPLCAITQVYLSWFGKTNTWTDKDGNSSTMRAMYLDEDNKVAAVSAAQWWNNYYRRITVNNVVTTSADFVNHEYAVFLVSDGGLTLSSQLDPSLNANNINAPVNNPAPEPAPEPTVPVNAPTLGALGLLLITLCSSRPGRKALFKPS